MLTLRSPALAFYPNNPQCLQIPGPLGHPVVQDAERLGRSGQEPAARLAAGPALHFHHGHQLLRDPAQEVGQKPAAQVAGGELALALVHRLGPLGGIEGQNRGAQRSGLESSPALVGEELSEHLTQELDVEVGGPLDPAAARKPLAEGGVELLPAGKAGLLQIGRGLSPVSRSSEARSWWITRRPSRSPVRGEPMSERSWQER